MPGQQSNLKTALCCVAAAFIGLAALDPARAEMLASPALDAKVTPALGAPIRPQPQDAQPEALQPQPAPLVTAPTPGDASGTAEVACRAPSRLTRLDHPLRRTARRLASGQPLVIVAIGSSSTAGAGASPRRARAPPRRARRPS